MLKKIFILIFALSFLSRSVMAYEIYAGLGVGPDYAKFQRNSSVNQVQNGRLNFNVKESNQPAGTGVFGTLFAGAGDSFCIPFVPDLYAYLGLELNANQSTLKYQMKNDEFVHSNFSTTIFRMRHAYGLSVLPGFLYHDDTLFYGRLGAARSNLEVATNDASVGSKSRDLNGFRWGLGLRQGLMQQLAFRMEYSHVNYGHLSTHTLDTTSNTAKKTLITPQTNEVEFGLVFLFC